LLRAAAGIYDQGKLQQLLASKGKQAAPEFFDPPSCPFYEVCLAAPAATAEGATPITAAAIAAAANWWR
jgi:hypothetical protein